MNPLRPSAAFFAFLMVALAFGVGTGQAEESWTPPGPAIGRRFPASLNLSDQAGVKRDLATLQGAKGTVAVFVRSADWCPFCMRQLADVNGRLPEFEALGLAVVQSLGIRDPAYGPDSEVFGVPQPIIFVLDRAKVVRAKFAEHGYRTRPDLDRVLEELGRLKFD